MPLFQFVLAIPLIVAMLGMFGRIAVDYRVDATNNTAAAQLNILGQSAAAYVRTNFASLLAATASAPVAVPIASLAAGGFMLPGATQVSPFGHQFVLLVEQQSGRLRWTLSAVGGDALEETRAGRIAAIVYAQGRVAGAFVRAAQPDRAICGAATCEVPIGTLASTGYGPTPGRPIVLGIYGTETALTNYLYRFPGIAGGNVMHQPLDMNGQNVVAAKDVRLSNSVSTGRGLSQAVIISLTVPPETIVDKPRCPDNRTPYLVVSPSSSHAGGDITTATSAWAEDQGANWLIHLHATTENGQQLITDSTARIAVFASCS